MSVNLDSHTTLNNPGPGSTGLGGGVDGVRNGATTIDGTNTGAADLYLAGTDGDFGDLVASTELARRGSEAPSVDDVLAGRGSMREGDFGQGVQELRGRLSDLGFRTRQGFSNDPLGVYGSHTANAVEGLQVAFGLEPTGVFDQTTARFLEWADSPYRGLIPAGRISTADYGQPRIRVPISGYDDPGSYLQISGAFQEPEGHGDKGDIRMIYAGDPSRVVTRPGPSNSNLGIDFVAYNGNGQVIEDVPSWFNGRVASIGIAQRFGGTPEQADFAGPWGRRVAIETDLSFRFQEADGSVNSYPIYAAYGHLDSIAPGLEVGDRVQAGQVLGEMGGAAGDDKPADYVYPEHVDLRTYIVHPQLGLVDIDPNLLADTAVIQNARNDPGVREGMILNLRREQGGSIPSLARQVDAWLARPNHQDGVIP